MEEGGAGAGESGLGLGEGPEGGGGGGVSSLPPGGGLVKPMVLRSRTCAARAQGRMHGGLGLGLLPPGQRRQSAPLPLPYPPTRRRPTRRRPLPRPPRSPQPPPNRRPTAPPTAAHLRQDEDGADDSRVVRPDGLVHQVHRQPAPHDGTDKGERALRFGARRMHASGLALGRPQGLCRPRRRGARRILPCPSEREREGRGRGRAEAVSPTASPVLPPASPGGPSSAPWPAAGPWPPSPAPPDAPTAQSRRWRRRGTWRRRRAAPSPARTHRQRQHAQHAEAAWLMVARLGRAMRRCRRRRMRGQQPISAQEAIRSGVARNHTSSLSDWRSFTSGLQRRGTVSVNAMQRRRRRRHFKPGTEPGPFDLGFPPALSGATLRAAVG